MAIDDSDHPARERLSALVDGELDSDASTVSCRAWTQDAQLRADWHAWHLIGDVLRSEDLASDPVHDRAFCARLRSRLEGEPVVLAPSPARVEAARPRPAPRRPGAWAALGAVAAGVVLVVGTFAVVRPGDSPATTQIARSDIPASIAASERGPEPPGAAAAEPIAIVADNKIIRDAQLERYLEAHKQFAGTSALGVPSAFLRSATLDSAAR